MKIRPLLLKLLHKLELIFDHWRISRRINKGKLGEVIIFPYRGYGNEKSISIRGRVLENNALAKPNPYDSTWTNIKAMARRYMSRELPYVQLNATYKSSSSEQMTDDEGYFHFLLDQKSEDKSTKLWHQVHFELLDQLYEEEREIKAVGEVLVPDINSHFGVISDIDDTVLISNTTHKIEIIKMAMINNATTRMPFRGVSKFYQALQKGSDGQQDNPIFYVSSSPWNMYDLLADFFELNQIPKGPILLRDIGISETKFIKEKHASHKLDKIRRILSFYPDLSFILIGDSGQHDPEIYSQVVEEFPGRILSIYIRDVTSDLRKETVKKIASQLAKKRVDLIIKEDTSEAAFHAESKGYIQKGKSVEIAEALKKDQQNL